MIVAGLLAGCGSDNGGNNAGTGNANGGAAEGNGSPAAGGADAGAGTGEKIKLTLWGAVPSRGRPAGGRGRLEQGESRISRSNISVTSTTTRAT